MQEITVEKDQKIISREMQCLRLKVMTTNFSCTFNFTTCLESSNIILWEHNASLASQSFRSVSTDLIISTDQDPSLRIESFAIINLRGAFPQNYILI